jgi:hypothetical protein
LKEFRKLQTTLDFYIPDEKEEKKSEEVIKAMAIKNMTHGMPVHWDLGMKDCLSWQAGRDAVEKSKYGQRQEIRKVNDTAGRRRNPTYE